MILEGDDLTITILRDELKNQRVRIAELEAENAKHRLMQEVHEDAAKKHPCPGVRRYLQSGVLSQDEDALRHILDVNNESIEFYDAKECGSGCFCVIDTEAALAEAQSEREEQARLLGMSASREAKLRARCPEGFDPERSRNRDPPGPDTDDGGCDS